jgi:hypothetical protein
VELRHIETKEIVSFDPLIKKKQITFDLLHNFNLGDFFSDDLDEVEIVIRKKIYKKEYRREVVWKEEK